MRDGNIVLGLYFKYMSALQIISSKSMETYTNELTEKVKEIMERDGNNKLSDSQWDEIVKYMRSKNHIGSLEAWKKLWFDNLDPFSRANLDIEEIFEEFEEESEKKINVDPEAVDTEFKSIDDAEFDDLIQPSPPETKENKRKLEKYLDDILKNGTQPVPPQTRNSNKIAKQIVERLF